MVAVGLFFSALIPPFQSPDEFDHIKRAYLLSKGQIILDVPEGRASGGMLDTGLKAYMNAYLVLPEKPGRKLSIDQVDSAKSIRWTGTREFSAAPGTGYYFPLIYAPQAVGLLLGETLGLSVDASYRLAKFVVLLAVALVLFAAFNLYPASPLAIALLILPMSVFQAASASIDGISNALAVFAMAAFCRLMEDGKSARRGLFYTFSLAVILVVGCRMHLLPLLVLLVTVSLFLKKKDYFYVAGLASLLVLAWLVIAFKTTVDNRVLTGLSTGSIASFYLSKPMAFVDVLAATLANKELMGFYGDSFLGVLGWLDTRFSWQAYRFMAICVLLIGLLSISLETLKTMWVPRAIVLACAFASTLLIFFALLVASTPHPAQVIQGIQGRYFLVPTIMVAYALAGGVRTFSGIPRKLALVLVLVLGAFTILGSAKLLMERYYLLPGQPEPVAIAVHPSIPLDQNHPIKVSFSASQISNPQPLKRIGIRLGTYGRENQGSAELRLATTEGRRLAIPFSLVSLADNQYKYFDLDGMPYTAGQIAYSTGGGISTWEADRAGGWMDTCLVLEHAGGKAYTPGCPRPE